MNLAAGPVTERDAARVIEELPAREKPHLVGVEGMHEEFVHACGVDESHGRALAATCEKPEHAVEVVVKRRAGSRDVALAYLVYMHVGLVGEGSLGQREHDGVVHEGHGDVLVVGEGFRRKAVVDAHVDLSCAQRIPTALPAPVEGLNVEAGVGLLHAQLRQGDCVDDGAVVERISNAQGVACVRSIASHLFKQRIVLSYQGGCLFQHE